MAKAKSLRELYQELINRGLIYPDMQMPGQFVYPSDQMAVPTFTTSNAFDNTRLTQNIGDDDAELESGIQ